MDAGTLYEAGDERWLVLASHGKRAAVVPVVHDRVRVAGDVPVMRGWIARTREAAVRLMDGNVLGEIDAAIVATCERAARHVSETASTVARYAPLRGRHRAA